MLIKHTVTGPIAVNTYVIINDNKCIVIDPGGNYDKIMNVIGDNEVCAVLLTHGHFDHIGAVNKFYEKGIDIYIHKDDELKLSNQKSLAASFGLAIEDSKATKLIDHDCELSIAGLAVKVLHTPGHSAGSVVYIIDDNIFSGDTIFYGSYGRTDFSDGDFYSMKKSIIDKIFSLNGEYNIYPGHEDFTTLSYEKMNNPILLW